MADENKDDENNADDDDEDENDGDGDDGECIYVYETYGRISTPRDSCSISKHSRARSVLLATDLSRPPGIVRIHWPWTAPSAHHHCAFAVPPYQVCAALCAPSARVMHCTGDVFCWSPLGMGDRLLIDGITVVATSMLLSRFTR